MMGDNARDQIHETELNKDTVIEFSMVPAVY